MQIATPSIYFIATWKEEVSIQWLRLILRSRYVMVTIMMGGRFDFNQLVPLQEKPVAFTFDPTDGRITALGKRIV